MKTFIGILFCIYQARSSNTEDENYNSTLASCLEFAAKFDNTCESQSDHGDFASIPSIEVKCGGYFGECPEQGTVSGESGSEICSFQRKLCISCYDDNGVTKIKT